MTVESSDIISIGENLVSRHPDAFGDDFETNKKKVSRLTDLRSRRVRNRVAGYITRHGADA